MFPFEMYALMTFMNIHLEKSPFKLIERSVSSVRLFLERAKDHMSTPEYEVGLAFVNFAENNMPPVNYIIYLQTTPENASLRDQTRERGSTHGLTARGAFTVIKQQHVIYEEHMSKLPNVITVNANDSEDKVFEEVEAIIKAILYSNFN